MTRPSPCSTKLQICPRLPVDTTYDLRSQHTDRHPLSSKLEVSDRTTDACRRSSSRWCFEKEKKKIRLYSIFLCKKKLYMNKMLFDEQLPLKRNPLKRVMNNKKFKIQIASSYFACVHELLVAVLFFFRAQLKYMWIPSSMFLPKFNFLFCVCFFLVS